MPEPGQDETRDEFIERCIPMVIEDGTAEDGEQAYAVCLSFWEEAHKGGKMADEQVVAFGGNIKAYGEGRVSGYLVRFTDESNPDLTGEFFTKDTDYDVEVGDRVTMYYSHGLNPTIGRRKLGRAIIKSIDDIGIFIDGELALRDEYEKAIHERLIKAGKTGWSSGTLSHLVAFEPRGESTWIKSWPIGKDASITVTPAAGPELTTVISMKSLTEMEYPELEALLPEAPGNGAADATDGGEYDVSVLQLRARVCLASFGED